MANSIPGYWLALIGGILGIFWGVITCFWSAAWTTLFGTVGALLPGFVTGLGILTGILLIVFGVLALMGGIWMKTPSTTKKGAIFALVFGVLGWNVLPIIGGILGLIASNK